MRTSEEIGATEDSTKRILAGATDSAQSAIQQKLYEGFNEARSRNPHVSLRAYARRLAVSPAALSEILRGKRRISMNRAKELIDRMGIDPQESEHILKLFAQESKSSNRKASSISGDVKALQMLTDQFNIASEWYHYAIVALAQTTDFNSRSEIIAKRLGISEKLAETAIERLLRAGILLTEDDKLVLRPQLRRIEGLIPINVIQSALRKTQTQNLDLARIALDQDNIEIHEFASLTLSMSPEHLGEARQKIKDFFESFEQSLEQNASRSEVFKLNLQLIQLSQSEKFAAASSVAEEAPITVKAMTSTET